MKKTLTINLGGIVFHIDEDAFEVLNSYLNTIRGYFDSSEGRDEIMSDIESRIAEMLQEKNKGAKEVINANDINQVIAVMGQPEDYLDEDMNESTSSTHSTQGNYSQQTTGPKRLYRDTEGATIGGVCSGLGYYTGLDPIWFKLAFVAAVFLGFSGILIYIIFWIVMPEARTSAEKLAMKGHPITFDNIGKTVEDSINNVKKKLHNLDGDDIKVYPSKLNSTIHKIVSFIGQLLLGLFRALGKLLGAIFIMGAFFGLIALLFGSVLPVNNLMFVHDGVPAGYNFNEISHLIYGNRLDYWVSVVGWWLMAGIPLVALGYAGLYLTARVKTPKYVGIAMAAGFGLGVVLFTFGGMRTGLDFATEKSIPSREALNTSNDTLYFDILDPRNKVLSSNVNFDYFVEIMDDGLIMGDIKIDILPSRKAFAEVEIIKTSRGGTNAEAIKRAEKIVYDIQLDSNRINLSPYLFINKEDQFRTQNVKVNLRLPEGKTVYIPNEYQYLLYDVKNYHNTFDQKMVNKYWTMTDSGLVTNNTDYTESVDYMFNKGDWDEKIIEEQIEKSVEILEKEIEENLEKNIEKIEIKVSEYEDEQNKRD